MEFDAASLGERMAEQLMSDERLLGAAPEEAVRPVLDHALARLAAAAGRAGSVGELEAAFEQIRADARSLLDEAGGQDDPAAHVRAALAGNPITPAPSVEASHVASAQVEQGFATAAGVTSSAEGADVPTSEPPAEVVGLVGVAVEGAEPQPPADLPPLPPQKRGLWSRVRRFGRRLNPFD